MNGHDYLFRRNSSINNDALHQYQDEKLTFNGTLGM